MNIIKGIKTLLLLFLVLIVFTSCRVIFFEPNAENLMKAPLSEEQNQIYQVIKEDIGSEFTHIYPDSGKHRYSYIFDEDKDGNERGLVFYKVEDNPSVRIAFIKKVEDRWEAAGSISSRADGVDQVEFANLSGEQGNIDLVVGYTLFSGDKVVVVYEWKKDMATPVFEESYKDFKTINDLSKKDIVQDERTYPKLLVLTGTIFGEEMNIIKLITKVDSDFESAEVNIHPLKSYTLDYSKMSVEQRENETIIYVDQLYGQGMRTDFFDQKYPTIAEETKEIGEIRTELFVVTKQGLTPLALNWELTKRPYSFGSYSRDIDDDGIIEVPTSNITDTIQISGDDIIREKTTLVLWMEAEIVETTDSVFGYPVSGHFVSDIYTVRNEVADYNYIIPKDWLGRVAIRTQMVKNEGSYLHFYTLGSQYDTPEERLITIYSKEIESQDDNDEISGYQHILTNDYFSYYVNINDEVKDTDISRVAFSDIVSSLIPKLEN